MSSQTQKMYKVAKVPKKKRKPTKNHLKLPKASSRNDLRKYFFFISTEKFFENTMKEFN